MQELFKYSGAGNDFIVLDGRRGGVDGFREPSAIMSLCDRHSGFVAADGRIGADGLMILSLAGEARPADGESSVPDFIMEYYNPDGSTGMMCGNGGRCIVAFADYLGIEPSAGGKYIFRAADGLHSGQILDREGGVCTVRLKMKDVTEFYGCLDGWFIDTGTRHFVKFVENTETVDVDDEGNYYRWADEFAPEGVNVNFVQVLGSGRLRVRTFEKGVEAETLACGTGIVASAIAYKLEIFSGYKVDVRARIDDLSVEFNPMLTHVPNIAEPTPGRRVKFEDVYLTGPAARIFSKIL